MSHLPELNPGDDLQVEIVEHDRAMTERSLARRLGLQVLYEVDSTNHNVEAVVTTHLETEVISRKAANYLRRLVRGVLENRSQIDVIIQEYASEWPLDQIAIIDRNVLRMAVYECVFETRVPVSVAIDEAVALANLYGAEGAPRFVNGVLGTLADNIDALRAKVISAGDKTS